VNKTLHTLSTPELVALIQTAAAELAGRLGAVADTPARPAPPAIPPKPPVDAPGADEQDFCMYVKRLLMSGKYISADERVRVADIASRYEAWVRRQGLPTESGTGPWRKAQHYHSAPRAKPRRL